MTPLSDTVIAQIKREHIAPTSVWRFRVPRLFRVLAIGVPVALMSFFTAFAVHMIHDIDWEAFSHTHLSWYQVLLLSVPYLWLILLALFLVLSIFLGERLRYGYRYPWWVFLGAFLVASTALGMTLERTQYDEPMEKFFMGSLSRHEGLKHFIPSAEKQWQHPEAGLLGGEIQSVDPQTKTLELQDQDNRQWEVNYQGARLETGDLRPQEQINIIGEKEDDTGFQADIIRKPKNHHSGNETSSTATSEKDSKEAPATDSWKDSPDSSHEGERGSRNEKLESGENSQNPD